MAFVKTQGIQLYMIDGTTVTKIDQVKSISLGSDSVNKIDVTTLDETVSKKYLSGLSDPSETTFSVLLDSASTAHKKVLELAKTKKEGIVFVLGASDGTADPTASGSGSVSITLPTSRTFWKWTGSVGSASLQIEEDNVAKYDISITRSSAVDVQFKTA